MKQIYKNDKPREKLCHKGAESLKNHELIAILLGSGRRGVPVLQMAKEIEALLEPGKTPDTDKLRLVKGIGIAKASQITAAFELASRFIQREKTQLKITSPEQVAQLLSDIAGKKQEHFVVITLDGANNVIERRIIFIGTLNQSLVHPREVFAEALSDRAASIILVHNHPSGTLEPSMEDLSLTQRLTEAGLLLGIDILDHVIITGKGFYSFKAHKKL